MYTRMPGAGGAGTDALFDDDNDVWIQEDQLRLGLVNSPIDGGAAIPVASGSTVDEFRFQQVQVGAFGASVDNTKACIYRMKCGGVTVYIGRAKITANENCRSRLQTHYNNIQGNWQYGNGEPSSTDANHRGYQRSGIGCHDNCIAACGHGVTYWVKYCPPAAAGDCSGQYVNNKEAVEIAAHPRNAQKPYPWCNANGGSGTDASGVGGGWAATFSQKAP